MNQLLDWTQSRQHVQFPVFLVCFESLGFFFRIQAGFLSNQVDAGINSGFRLPLLKQLPSWWDRKSGWILAL